MADVFLSYKREDAARVRKLVAALHEAELDVWWDEDIPPSAPWEATIEKALAEAKAVVVCWSPASVASENVRSEARVAREDGRLIQVFVRPSTPPLFFGERQGIDLSNWRGNADDKRIATLAKTIRSVAAGKRVADGLVSSPPRAAMRVNRIALLAAVVLLIIGAAGFFAYRAFLPARQPQIAVLPFRDLSPTHDKAYFAEGIAEEVLSTLAAEKGIKVLGRTSARQIESNPNPKAIRASLGVTHLLEGSTRTAGNDLRVNVRLIDTSDGSQLWEEEYRGAVSDVFKVQDQIAIAVVRRLRGSVFNEAVKAAPTTTIDAYEAYLAARALIRQTTKPSITRAWQMARAIVDAHPDYAPGQALYADATSLLAEGPFTYGDIPPDKARRIATAHAKEAIRLAPDRADGYAALGLALPPQQAIGAYQKALTFDPSRVDVRGRLGIALNELKRNDEAFEHYRLAAEMDPLSQAMLNRYAQTLAASGRADDAMRAIDLYERRGGSKAQAWRFRGNTFRYLADESRHIEARRRALNLDPSLPYQHEWLVQALHLLGLNDEAAAYRSKVSSYFQAFVSDDRGALRQRLLDDGASAWHANGVQVAVFSLARARDWAAIARFYDVRPEDYRNLCETSPPFAVFIVMALERDGRAAEAQRLLGCTQEQIIKQLRQRYRNPDDAPGELEMMQASLLASRGDRRALDWLDKAVARGWLGQYYSSQLSDWPQFDPLHADPRFAALQAKIDRRIAQERSEVLRQAPRASS
jgi:TolB-like protein/Tfp pilus assembly protein PilF